MAKLVEILARELKEWPMARGGTYHTEAVAQDLDGGLVRLDHLREPHPTQFNGEDWSRGCWTGYAYYVELSEDHATAIVTRAEWQAAVDALKAKDVVEWDGVGLPPVGVSCERRFPDVRGSSWNGCIILAHGARRIFVRDNCGDEWAHNIDEVEFRPFRTPDRIAAYELRAIIESGLDGRKTLDQVIEEVIGAGYRKQGQK